MPLLNQTLTKLRNASMKDAQTKPPSAMPLAKINSRNVLTNVDLKLIKSAGVDALVFSAQPLTLLFALPTKDALLHKLNSHSNNLANFLTNTSERNDLSLIDLHIINSLNNPS
jgi:hypothetical protein